MRPGYPSFTSCIYLPFTRRAPCWSLGPGDAAMMANDRRSAPRRSGENRRSGKDRRSDVEQRALGERRSGKDRRAGGDRRAQAATAAPAMAGEQRGN